jgi:signal transduction histidine kinase
MMVGSSLLRRQIFVITLLVTSLAIALVAFNVSHLVSSLVSRTGTLADSIALQTANAIETAIVSSPEQAPYDAIRDSPFTRQYSTTALSGDGTVIALTVRDSSNSAVFSAPATSGFPLASFDSLRSKSSLMKTVDVLSARTPVYRYSRQVFYRNALLGYVDLDLSLERARQEIFQTLLINLLIVLASIAAALFIAVVSARLISTPLRAITSSIEQLEQHHYQLPDAGSAGAKSNYIDLVAGRIEQIGRQIAGDRTELREARGRLNQILTNLRERVLLVNADGEIMLASPGVEELLGARGPAEGRMLEDFAGSDHPLVILVRLAIASGESPSHATLPGMNDDRSKPLASTVQLIFERGAVAGALVSLHDRETVAKLESQLDYSERLADFARITSGIAHEVKNPLNAMVIHIELLKEKLERLGPGTSHALPQLEILTSEIQRLDRVVQTFLNFTKPPRMQLRPLDVNQVLEETLALAEAEAQAHSASVKRLFASGLPRVAGDADLLKQAFLNIIINGFQAMEQGGRLEVQTSDADSRAVRISIRDHGPGIDPEARDRIFQLYYSTRSLGNGIGLAQAYRAIQLHNGRISFETAVGAGTTFHITIPAA